MSATDCCHGGGALTYVHKKLRLFILINNNEVAVSSARKLVQRLELGEAITRATGCSRRQSS